VRRAAVADCAVVRVATAVTTLAFSWSRPPVVSSVRPTERKENAHVSLSLFLSALFPMFVPSLSWSNDQF
jgi:hypothetical protein